MLSYPQIDPVALSVGPFAIHWYGLMYLFGFIAAWVLGRRRGWHIGWRPQQVDDYATWAMFGVLVGGRIGYVLFYDLANFMADPLEIVRLWNGGMSFHGGFLGVLFVSWLFARRHDLHFLQMTDFAAPLIPLGLFFGRIGNFINAELWGRAGDVPWAMVFPGAGPLARHPSQLYEAALEGLLLFVVLWLYSAQVRALGRISGVFALGYGLFRFLVEFVREPDEHLGFIAFGWMSMGQLLCVPLIAVGLWLLLRPVEE